MSARAREDAERRVPSGRLLEGVASPGRDLVLPVTNEPWSEEARGSPAFTYLASSVST